jgi:hypothetical protein
VLGKGNPRYGEVVQPAVVQYRRGRCDIRPETLPSIYRLGTGHVTLQYSTVM